MICRYCLVISTLWHALGINPNGEQIPLYSIVLDHFLARHQAVLFNGPPKLEACWSSKSQELCEWLGHKFSAQHD